MTARRGALLHDLGKLGVPERVLLKPDPLTDAEWGVLRQQPEFAQELMAPVAHLRSALAAPYGQHERWDGAGYPRGLAGDEIPLAARLCAVASAWEALTAARPYRAALPPAQARALLQAEAGRQFDPRVVREFLAWPE
jgi:HD-GYP domain-containing protein (c-di-GMP phosphodiesterase class II)